MLGLAAAGCGGSSSDTKANKAYADSVCTAIGKWEQQIKQIATDFSGGISKASLQSKVTQAEAATKTLASEIRAAPPPNSEQGKAAKQQLDQLTSDVQATVNSAQSSLAQLQGNASPSTIAAALAALAPQVQGLVNNARTALVTIKGAGGSLASAFKSTDSCKSIA